MLSTTTTTTTTIMHATASNTFILHTVFNTCGPPPTVSLPSHVQFWCGMIHSYKEKCVRPLMAQPICCWKKDCCPDSESSSYSDSAFTPLPDIPPWEPGGYSKTFELWMAEEKKIGANSRSYLDGYLHHATVEGKPGDLHPNWPKEFTALIRKSVKKSRVRPSVPSRSLVQ